MAGEVTELVATTLGGNFQALRVQLQEAVDGGMLSGTGEGTAATGWVTRWPAATGMRKVDLEALETFITNQFLPALRAGISNANGPVDIEGGYSSGAEFFA